MGCGVIISNNGIVTDEGYKFQPKIFCLWDNLPFLLRGYEISRNIIPCRLFGEKGAHDFVFNFSSTMPPGLRVSDRRAKR
jgi:hypothetical protein